MCGLVGIYHGLNRGIAEQPMDQSLLRRMTNAIAHRGPDGEGFYVEPGVGLGFRRLAIIDLAGGDQPMSNEDSSVILVFNGEIYNFQSLRTSLIKAGHRFKSSSDSEVILHGWEEWGLGVLERLSGMFALALWDRGKKTLLLARDRLGKKPLYYGITPDRRLIFGSELSALAEVPGLLDKVNAHAVEDYFTFGYIPDPLTIYQGVYKLPAAHYILVRDGASFPVPLRYWELPAGETDATDASHAVELLRLKLKSAVASRLVADVPIGAFLSGGVDSATVVALATSLQRDPLQCFTIGFPGRYDERAAALEIATHCKAAHHTEMATEEGILAAASAQAQIFGEPFGDMSAVPTLALAKLARRHVTVALSGDGGDEVFAGYRRYRWLQIAEAVRKVFPGRMRRQLLGSFARLYPKLDRAPRWLRAKNTLTEISLDAAHGYYRTLCKTDEQRRHGLFSPRLLAEIGDYAPADQMVRIFQETDEADPLYAAQRVDFATYLPGDILVKVDRTSMAVGLEVRCPFLDNDVASWGLALSPELKYKNGTGKHVLRAAAAPMLPPSVFSRPKQGFAVPLGVRIRHDMAAVSRVLQGPTMMDSGLFNEAALARMVAEHASGSFDHAQPIWQLLVFEGFLRRMACQENLSAIAYG
jgi:asparagine synthase (glutamine-hydrolysing)